jgi:hypothetical protein
VHHYSVFEEVQLSGKKKQYCAEMDIDMLEKYKDEEIDVQEEVASAKDHFTKVTSGDRISGSSVMTKKFGLRDQKLPPKLLYF